MKPYTYLLIDFCCIIIPFLASFYAKRPFFREWKAFFSANIIVAFPFLVWDFLFTQKGVWGFNPDYLTGYYLLNLPVEEILFFICIPYACVFTYFAFGYLIEKPLFSKFQIQLKVFFLMIALLFMTVGFNQLYTFYTGLFTGGLMLFSIWKKVDLRYAFIAYFAIIPFFLISNGLLTGSFLDAPIVWYNDAENFGIRIFTIPIEDSIYGFLLIMLNIVLFEQMRSFF